MVVSHPLVDLARRTIEAFVRNGREAEPPENLTPEMQRRAGAFVTLHHRGQLRGCIGTIEPICENVANEVIRNAISAATRDPRFPPHTTHELADREVKVDVLGEPTLVSSSDELDPKRYGLIVQSVREPWKRGVLLPDLEGIESVEKQIFWTRHHKAGITDPDEPVQMFRFEVMRLS